jgi:hypothetical protein
MTRMRFSFWSAPDQLCTGIPGSSRRDTDFVLYWVHDTSPGCQKTYRLIDSTAPLVERLIRLARVPGLRSLVRRLLRVADDVLY